MRRIFAVLMALFLILAVTSCTAAEKTSWSQTFSYKDPQSIGGYWDVTMQTGQTFQHVKCTYWGTNDDTAVFEADDGCLICQSGAVVCVYVGDR